VTDIKSHANPFTDGVIVMGWHQRQHLQAVTEFQRVQKVGAAKQFAYHARLERRSIVVQDVVGAQQDIEIGLFLIIAKAGGSDIMHIAERSRHGQSQIVAHQSAGDEHPVPDEVRHKARSRTVIQGIGLVPLFQIGLLHDADDIADGKCFHLVVRHHQRRDACLFQDVPDIVGQPFA